MLSRAHNRSRYLFTLLLAGVAAMCGAKAATYTYNLAGDPVDVTTSSDIGGSCGCLNVQSTLVLVNTATGLNSVPAITLNDGDTINGTIMLDSPWTMPASSPGAFFGIGLQSGDGISVSAIATDDSFSFLDHGVPVPVPAAFEFQSGVAAGGPGLMLSMASPLFDPPWVPTSSPTPAFTFDQIDFSGTMTWAANGSHQVIDSAPLISGVPYIVTLTSPPPAAAPELDPAFLGSALTLLVGGLAMARGRRTRDTEA